MRLEIQNSQVVKIPNPPLTEERKEEIINVVKGRFGKGNTGVILCRECRQPMELVDNLTCDRCRRFEDRIDLNLEERDIYKQRMLILGLSIMVGALVIAVFLFLTSKTTQF